MADPHARGPRRRWALALGVLVLLALGLVLAAPRGIELALTRALVAQGAGPVRLEVASLGLAHLELRDVQLGPAPNLEVGRLRVELTGPVPALELVAIEDLTYVDRRMDEPSWVETLIGEPAADAPDDGAAPVVLPRRLRVERAQARIETPTGLVEGAGEATLSLTPRGGVEGDASAELRLAGRPVAELALEASEALVALGIDAELGAETLMALGLPGARSLRVDGRLEAPPEARADLATLLAAAQGRFLVEGELAREELAGTGSVDLDLDGETLVVRAEARNLRSGEVRVASASFGGSIGVASTPSGVDLHLPSCVAFEARRVRLPGGEDALRGDGPWTGCLMQAEAPWIRAVRDEAGWRVTTATRVRDVQLALVQAEQSLLRGRLPELTLHGETLPEGALRGRVTARGGDLAASDGLVRLSAVDLAADLDASVPARATAKLRVEDEGRSGEPLRVELDLDRSTAPWGVSVALREDDDAGVNVTGTGTFDPTGPTAAFDLALAPLAFDAETRQPEDYWPELLVALGSFEGTIEGTAKVAFADGALDTNGRLELEGGGLHGGALVLEGAAGALAFSNLLPLTSAPAQRLRFDKAVAGVPLEDGQLTIEIGPGWQAVRVPSLTGRLLGGRLDLEATLDLATERHEARIRLDALDLGDVLAFADRPELSGAGSLTGELPVVWNAGQLVVSQGRIEATPPEGRVRYRPDAPPAALAGAGEYGALALRALEDFHYDGLEVTIDAPPGENARVMLSLRGANPEVQGGQPIHLNLDLSGPLLEVLQTDPRLRDFAERVGREATKAGR